MSSISRSSSVLSLSENWGTTQVNLDKISYTWKVINFSICREEMDQVLLSPIFWSVANDAIKWRLRLIVKSLDPELKDYVSLFLELVSSNQDKVRVKFDFSIFNEKGKNVENHGLASRFAEGNQYGVEEFIHRGVLLDTRRGFLPDDVLTVHCNVYIVQDSVTLSNQSDSVQFKIPNCNLSDDFAQLFEDQEYSDVTLSVNGHEYRAHKAILAARSKVFAAMFKHDMKEKNDGKVEICDFDEVVITEMLRFIYTGNVLNLDEIADDLLGAADKYHLERLKVLCEQALFTNLSIENVVSTLHLAHLHHADQLKGQAIQFIRTHATEVTESSQFETMCIKHPQLIAEIIKDSAKQ